MINGMKFNNSKCWILYLGWSNAGHKHKLGEEWLESRPGERDLEVLAGSRHQSAAFPGSREGKPHPEVHQTQHSQPVKRGDYPAVFSAAVASP